MPTDAALEELFNQHQPPPDRDSDVPTDGELALEDLQTAVVGERPEIDDTPEVVFELPRGLLHEGVWHTEVEVRELTGRDEEQLSKAKNGLGLYEGVLARGVVRIGKVDFSELPISARSKMLAELLLGERQLIALRVLVATFGNQRTLTTTCPACGEEWEADLHLTEDFPFVVPEGADQFTHTFTTRRGNKITYRMAIGADEDAIAGSGKKVTLSEQNSIMLGRIITHFNEEQLLGSEATDIALDMSIPDRRAFIAHVGERQPYVDYDLRLTCQACDTEFAVPASWEGLFRL